MKKYVVLLLLTALLSACSFSIFPTPVPPTARPTQALPTIIPASKVPSTYTSTPTLIGGRPTFTPTETPPASSTFLLVTLPTGTPEPSSTAPSAIPSGLEGSGFESVELSVDEFHWGSCEPNTTTLTVKVTNPAQVLNVVVFVRFRNKASGNVTGWDDGTSMESKGGGTFAFKFDGDLMGVYYNSWVAHQLVGTDATGANVARSPVFPEQLSLSPCP